MVSVIGIGKVGSLTVQHLLEFGFKDIHLIGRSKEKTEGLILDLVSAYPELHQSLHVGSTSDVNNSEIVIITAGATAKPNQNFSDLRKANFEVIKNIVGKCSFNPRSIIVLTTTPVDETAEYFQELTNHPKEKVLGFGGSLDVSRLKYLLAKETGKNPDTIECYFIGVHGAKGIPIIRDKVKNRENLIQFSKNYFSETAKRTGQSSVFGPARQLAILTENIAKNDNALTNVSTFHPKYGMYVTWPVKVGKNGVVSLKNLELTEGEQKELGQILAAEKLVRTN